MKVIAIYASSRKKGFSALAVDIAVKHFEDKSDEVKKYYLPQMNIKACTGCFAAVRKMDVCFVMI